LGAVIFGSILLVAGIITAVTHRRAVRKGTERLNGLLPNSDHRTVLKVGASFRLIFVVLTIAVGIVMIPLGLLGVLK
jgi:hypothetical protein